MLLYVPERLFKMTLDQIKKEILEVLKRGSMASTTIATLIKENYWKVVLALNEMEQEGLLVNERKTKNQSVWKLKEEVGK